MRVYWDIYRQPGNTTPEGLHSRSARLLGHIQTRRSALAQCASIGTYTDGQGIPHPKVCTRAMRVYWDIYRRPGNTTSKSPSPRNTFSNHQSPRNKIANHQSPGNKHPNHQSPRSKHPNNQSPRNKHPNNQSPRNNILITNHQEINILITNHQEINILITNHQEVKYSLCPTSCMHTV